MLIQELQEIIWKTNDRNVMIFSLYICRPASQATDLFKSTLLMPLLISYGCAAPTIVLKITFLDTVSDHARQPRWDMIN
jgi:hypothetical protein